MPSGIILASGSEGATTEQLEEVFTKNGLEVDKPEPAAAEPVEPKREDFESDDEFEAAKTEFETKQEERAQKEEDEEEQKRLRQEERHKPSRRQRAVDKATRELRDELRKANERIAALEGKKPGTETAEVKAPEPPKREAYKSDAEFEDAMFDYRYKLRRAKEQAEEAQQSIEQRLQASFADYQNSVADFKEDHDDWDDVVGSDRLRIPEPAYYTIVELGKDGPRVTYYLATHEDAIEKLKGMTPYAMAVEIGRIADKLKAGQKPNGEEKKTTTRPRVPEPVKPLSTSAAASTLTSRDAAQKRDFKAFKAAQRRGA